MKAKKEKNVMGDRRNSWSNEKEAERNGADDVRQKHQKWMEANKIGMTLCKDWKTAKCRCDINA